MKPRCLKIPAGGVAKVCSLELPDFAYGVLIVADPADATPEAMFRVGGQSALLTHGDGLTWPDRRGESLAIEVLAIGGAVCLAFPRRVDAMRCKARLEGGGR